MLQKRYELKVTLLLDLHEVGTLTQPSAQDPKSPSARSSGLSDGELSLADVLADENVLEEVMRRSIVDLLATDGISAVADALQLRDLEPTRSLGAPDQRPSSTAHTTRAELADGDLLLRLTEFSWEPT